MAPNPVLEFLAFVAPWIMILSVPTMIGFFIYGLRTEKHRWFLHACWPMATFFAGFALLGFANSNPSMGMAGLIFAGLIIAIKQIAGTLEPLPIAKPTPSEDTTTDKK